MHTMRKEMQKMADKIKEMEGSNNQKNVSWKLVFKEFTVLFSKIFF